MNDYKTIENADLQRTLGRETDSQRTLGNADIYNPQYDSMQFDPYEPQPAAMFTCPNCGAKMEEGADFCEMCRTYVKQDVCAYCGAHLEPDNAFCPECGNQRGGLVCPQCNTLNDFAFCKQCGNPLTDEARELMMRVHATQEYKHLQSVVNTLVRACKCTPCDSEEDIQSEEANKALRERVLKLLAEDAGEVNPVIKEMPSDTKTTEELNKEAEDLADQIMEALEKLAITPSASPVKARNYAMATKPAGVRLAWMCNYKHAVHSSPCGCAKPHLGGKWIILGKGKNITND